LFGENSREMAKTNLEAAATLKKKLSIIKQRVYSQATPKEKLGH